MTAKEAALDLIRTYVLRGDDYDQYRRSLHGAWNDKYHASVSGYVGEKRYDTHHVIVTRLGKKEVRAVYKLRDLWDEIKQGQAVLL